MATPTPNRIYISGVHTPVAVGAPAFQAPFAGINIPYVLTQDFQCDINSYAPLALNTAHPTETGFVLVAESETRDMGGGMVRWTRTYAKVPASYSEPGGNYGYNFIGLIGGGGTTLSFVARQRFTRNVPVLIQRDFYLVGPGGTHANFEDIPSVSEQRYLTVQYPTPNLDTDYLDGPGYTSPDRDVYQAWIAADETSNSFSIVAESSTLTRWMGNIYMRETRRVKAR